MEIHTEKESKYFLLFCKKKKKGIYVKQIFANISTYIYMILTIIYHNS